MKPTRFWICRRKCADCLSTGAARSARRNGSNPGGAQPRLPGNRNFAQRLILFKKQNRNRLIFADLSNPEEPCLPDAVRWGNKREEKYMTELICTACRTGCRLTVDTDRESGIRVSGKCAQGRRIRPNGEWIAAAGDCESGAAKDKPVSRTDGQERVGTTGGTGFILRRIKSARSS